VWALTLPFGPCPNSARSQPNSRPTLTPLTHTHVRCLVTRPPCMAVVRPPPCHMPYPSLTLFWSAQAALRHATLISTLTLLSSFSSSRCVDERRHGSHRVEHCATAAIPPTLGSLASHSEHLHLRSVVLRPECTPAHALGHRSTPPPWLADRAPWPPSFGLLRSSSTQTDHAVMFLVTRHASRAPRLTDSALVVGCHRSTGRQAAYYHGRVTVVCLELNRAHQRMRVSPALLSV
jgi:hypothetical protein